MQTLLYGGKILTLHSELSPYRKKPLELWKISLGIVTQIYYFKKAVLWNKILVNNIIFIIKSIHNILPPIFKCWFIFCSDIYNYDTVSSSADKLFKPSYRTDCYGKTSVFIVAINFWNKTQKILRNQSLRSLYPNNIKTFLTKRCIDKY